MRFNGSASMVHAGRRPSPWGRWGWRLPSDRWWPALSGRGRGGIGEDVASLHPALTRRTRRTDAAVLLAAVVAVVTSAAGCGLRGLAHDQLYGSPDAGRMP